MKLSRIRIQNFKSIVDSGNLDINSLQILVGENNAGKSNILKAVKLFLTAGKNGIDEKSFFDKSQPIVITAEFCELGGPERKNIRKYLRGDLLSLEKHLICSVDDSGKYDIDVKYHGYIANPCDWWLSTDGVNETKGSRPRWAEIAEEYGLSDYVTTESGDVNKTSYEKGLKKYLLDHDDILYDEPALGDTQALGISTYLVDQLPEFYLLPAITDYSNEIDRRSSKTVFRKLMGELSERIISSDPRYNEVESTIQKLVCLLNPDDNHDLEPERDERLETLGIIESALHERISRLMPSVISIRLEVLIDEVKDFFSRGVAIRIDDGVMTDVLDKGHGLQRCVVFGLLQTLIANVRGELIPIAQEVSQDQNKIILAIEEPELYIHPQMQRPVYGVLKEFAQTDQVIYSTHSPAFIDVWKYHQIGVVRKDTIELGTKVHQCEEGILGTPEERRGFQFLNSFGLEQNSLFFAKHSILVEGEQDVIALIATGRKLGLFEEFPEEIGYSIIVTGSKGELPKFEILLNAFGLPFTVLLELDGNDENEETNKKVLDLLNGRKCVKILRTLEDLLGRTGHFGRTFTAKKFFENPDNINPDLESLARDVFSS
ncbi:MAG: ATP-dependent endonuclease [Candidatus Thorarchaeota archaeon]|nr:ATP-dependent endonuclease [Candidatus Thorarchaeota archaeon]